MPAPIYLLEGFSGMKMNGQHHRSRCTKSGDSRTVGRIIKSAASSGPRGIASEVLSSIEPAQGPGRSPAETSAPLPTRGPGRLLIGSPKPSWTQEPEQLPTRSSARLWSQNPGQSPAGSPMPGNYCFFLSMNSIIWTDSASDQPQVRAKCVPKCVPNMHIWPSVDLLLFFGWCHKSLFDKHKWFCSQRLTNSNFGLEIRCSVHLSYERKTLSFWDLITF